MAFISSQVMPGLSNRPSSPARSAGESVRFRLLWYTRPSLCGLDVTAAMKALDLKRRKSLFPLKALPCSPFTASTIIPLSWSGNATPKCLLACMTIFWAFHKPTSTTFSDQYDALDDSDDWALWMEKWGLKEEIYDCIMRPEFKPTRLTRSASFWVKDSFAVRQRALLSVKESGEAWSQNLLQESLARPGRGSPKSWRCWSLF